MDKLPLVLAPLEFLNEVRLLSWSVAILGIVWLVLRKFLGLQDVPRLTLCLWFAIEIMGAVVLSCVLVWYLGFDKSRQGLPFIAAILSGLPLLIPAAIGLLVKPLI